MAICDIPGISDVCEAVGDTQARVMLAPFDMLGQGAAGAAKWMVEAVWLVMDSTTAVDVTTPTFVSVYELLFGIGITVALLFFFLQLATGLIRRDPHALSYALIGLARAVLGGFLVLTLTAMVLEVVDQLSIGIVHATGNTMETLADKASLMMVGLVGLLTVGGPGVGILLLIFVSFFAMAAAFILWMSMLTRKVLLLVSIVLAPLALSGTVWEATKGWVGKWAAFVLALAISKLVVVVIFLVATAQMAAPITLDLGAITEPLSGIVLMLVAGFAPFIVYKLISFIGLDLYLAMSAEQEAKDAANRPLPIITRPPSADTAKKVLDSKSSGESSPNPPATGPGDTGSPTGEDAPVPGNSGAVAPTEGMAEAGTESGMAEAGIGAEAGSAGVAAPVLVVAEVVKETAEAGPAIGNAVGQGAEGHVSAAQSDPPPASQQTAPPPTVVSPSAPASGASES
ncbi:conjugal transfer protein TrbL [Leucobacter sp. UCD-THU]|uniref:hypothetical protein n=1 Tax=Leucobacter sp. UCD-THU TaxID=1292023 RepID=UPI000380512B|nr:hypothetical protein [Leucobacter sp. UCD-THU]EYT56579.1 conjugal transfer protein TrbL [Leucobacter sp. UCD-THU]